MQQPLLNRAFRCRCGSPVFFENSVCLRCGTLLGYEAASGAIVALDAVSGLFRCANFETAAACNWTVAVAGHYCESCALNRTIPGPSDAEAWRRIEVSKRRVVSSLIMAGLPVQSRLYDDPVHGLAFDFLRSPEGGPRVLTGHADGVITLNLEESIDSEREKARESMGEPYRTLVGHFRHELGHYYWDRLVKEQAPLAAFRELFGDERQDYAAALARHHAQGPPADWSSRFVSAYASSHPWEDWAETWAHYLHFVDTLSTAESFGVISPALAEGLLFDLFTPAALWHPEDRGAMEFLELLNRWVRLTAVLNELARSMGQPDLYPFALPVPAVAKLQFIHQLVDWRSPDALRRSRIAAPADGG